MSLALLAVMSASFLAGVVDAMVGGGGLLTVPALFGAYPLSSPALLLGTNKCSSVFGTLLAVWQYGRHLQLHLHLRKLVPSAVAAFVGALLGAWTLTRLEASVLREVCPYLLTLMLLYTLLQPRLGVQETSVVSHRPLGRVLLLTAGIGWYDGFFGPGTGSMFILMLVHCWRMDFLHASAHAKVLNAATNLAALLLLASHGHVWWQVGGCMAIANMMGSVIGAWLAMRHGAAIVRQIFVLVVLALIVKTAYDAYG